MRVTHEQVVQRRKVLDDVGAKLKDYFIGIDAVVDELMSQIEAWWCIPDFLDRPAIVNLWGMTGVGKTDLVRRLVAELDMRTSFTEITMTSSGDRWDNSVEKRLTENQIVPDAPAILLIDEFQRFRTIDETGAEISGENFSDLWGLLSDGKFESAMAHKRRCELFRFTLESRQALELTGKGGGEDDDEDVPGNYRGENPKEEKRPKRPQLQNWEIDDLKEILGDYTLRSPIYLEDGIRMVSEQLHRMKQNVHYTPQYTKLLIIISANLDEAFHDADSTDDATRDADSFHESSKAVTVFDIKKQLLKRFRPEQIARLGNNHIIYPTLSKKSFEVLIQRRLTGIQERVKNDLGFDLSYDNKLAAMLYANGVFPAQGVRPVLSTITSIVENNVPYMMMEAMRLGVESFKLGFNEKKCVVKYSVGNRVFTRKVSLPVTDTLKRIRDEMFIRICIHEAGHALLCALLFRMAPTVVNLRDVWGGGRVWFHNDAMDHQSNKNMLVMLYGGVEAESLVLGSGKISNGAENDFKKATALASQLVKYWALYPNVTTGTVVNGDSPETNFTLNLDMRKQVNNLLRDSRLEAQRLLSEDENRDLLIRTAQFFQRHDVRLEGQELVDFWATLGFTDVTAQTFHTPWYGESIKEIWETAVKSLEK